jgi:hypothetical protein
MKPGRLDRTAFKHQTLEEAAHNFEYWKKTILYKKIRSGKLPQ